MGSWRKGKKWITVTNHFRAEARGCSLAFWQSFLPGQRRSKHCYFMWRIHAAGKKEDCVWVEQLLSMDFLSGLKWATFRWLLIIIMARTTHTLNPRFSSPRSNYRNGKWSSLWAWLEWTQMLTSQVFSLQAPKRPIVSLLYIYFFPNFLHLCKKAIGEARL